MHPDPRHAPRHHTAPPAPPAPHPASPDPRALPLPSASAVARLQAAAVVGSLVLATAVLVAWPGAPGIAVVAILMGLQPAALALEQALAARVHGDDPAPRPSAAQRCRAWWREAVAATRVFGWDQPFRWRAEPDVVPTGDGSRAPVLLVHGYLCNRGFWRPWLRALRAQGRPVVALNLEPVFTSIDDYAPVIERGVAQLEALTGRRPVVVAHSMGGLAVRAWMAATPGGRARVARVITLGSPHRGTWLARLGNQPNARQMRPGSDWLQALAQREPPRAFDGWVCWYSSTDNVVFPPSTATLPGADNRHVAAAGHVDLAFQPSVMAASLAVIASADNSP